MKRLTKKIVSFRDRRNWKQFHNPKDLSISLVLEATELMEHFQWKNAQEMEEHVKKNKVEISEEIADVLYYLLLMSHDMKVDVEKALDRKIEINDKKYPVEKSRGTATKYNEL
ncbi:MAG: nucleotide pyrophosphohydrolase [bacterium]